MHGCKGGSAAFIIQVHEDNMACNIVHKVSGKRDPKKTSQNKFCFAYILAGNLPIFKILVSIPHN